MSDDICKEFLQQAKRRRHAHGVWRPVSFWTDALSIDNIDHIKLKQALDAQGLLNRQLEEHDNLLIEFLRHKASVDESGTKQKRWFVCVATPDKPEVDSEKKRSEFAAILQETCNQHNRQSSVTEEASLDLTATEHQITPRPPNVERNTNTTTAATAQAVSPVTDSPQLKDDNDSLEFFRGILNPTCVSKGDLLLPTLSSIGLRKKLKSFGMQLATNDHQKTCTSFHEAPEVYLNKDITTLEPDQCLMNRFGIPMSVPAMTEVATAIINLSEQVPEILQLPKHSGSKGSGKRIVTIVPSSDQKRFYQNAKRWMEHLLTASTTDNDTNDESSLGTYEVVHVLTRVLHTFDPVAVEAAVESLTVESSSLSQHKLDPLLQQAMTYKAKLKAHQLRTIKSYLCYANLDVLQPESVMTGLQVKDFVKPIPIEFREGKGNRRRVSHTIPLEEMLMWHVNKALDSKSFDYSKLTYAHVILVGDHGQGAFRMMATLLLITREERRTRNTTVNPFIGSKLALEVDGLCGYIQCQKDTYSVLKETIAVPINESLHYIRDQKELTIYQDAGAVKMCWGKPNVGTILETAPIEVFMTGDLAFYSMALGKEHMAPHWCWRCDCSKKDWNPTDNDDYEPKPLGNLWTIDGYKSHLNRLQAGDLDSEERRGVTAFPLFDSIPVENILVPPLHNKELFVNAAINFFLKWINYRIEDLPMEIITARNDHIDLCLQQEKIKKDVESAMGSMPFLTSQWQSLKPKKRSGTKEVIFQDDEHKTDFEDSERLLNEARARLKEHRKKSSAMGDKVRASAKSVKATEKKKEHGALSQVVRQRIEQMLQEVYNIIRSSYHGGDFEGNHCRKWLRNSKSVMDSTQVVLLSIPVGDRTADDEEIRKVCVAYTRLFQYMDVLVWCCQQPFGTLTDSDMTDVRKLISMLDRLWRRLFHSVQPKAHAWWHLIVDLERLRGLKHHQESKIEVSHQVGRKIDLLYRGVHDIKKKIDASQSYQHTMVDPSLMMMQSTVEESRKRKFVDTDEDDSSHHGLSESRREVLFLPEIDTFFQSLLELAKGDRMWAIDTGQVSPS